jgi:hypothetical protein
MLKSIKEETLENKESKFFFSKLKIFHGLFYLTKNDLLAGQGN